jgi:predicted metal-dependent hydrolase
LPPEPAPLDPNQWQASREYLFGCDLFNHGYYWEAHEVWESLWKACGRSGTTADFLKGLIKLAAAGVKHREGRPEGVRRHAARAVELFTEVEQAIYAGLDVPLLRAIARDISTRLVTIENPAALAPVAFNFRLVPGT